MRILLLLLIPAVMMAQIKGVVRDETTGKPISYANIWADGSGQSFSADEDGNFSLEARPGTPVTFSAIGYETKEVKASETAMVRLKAITYALEGITISKPKRTIEAQVGCFRKDNIDLYYGTSSAYLYARYFAPDAQFSKTPYLKEITVMTKSEVRDAKFNVHFLEANQDGTPGAEIGTGNIIGMAKKGKRYTVIDLKGLGLRIPENGFFIALETLIVPENRYVEFAYTDKNKVYHERIFYAPVFGTIRTETNTSWGFGEKHDWGAFGKVSQERIRKYYDDYKKSTGHDAPPFDNRYNEFAITLTLTN